jgi:drug/metabolite transporter (DMT)-like permease
LAGPGFSLLFMTGFWLAPLAHDAVIAPARQMLALQVLAQGLGAGLVAVLAFSRAVNLLGSGQAAFFGALVPGAASLPAVAVLGEVPATLQVLGLLAVVSGLLVVFGAARMLGVNSPRRGWRKGGGAGWTSGQLRRRLGTCGCARPSAGVR